MTALAGFFAGGSAAAARSCGLMLRAQAVYGPDGSAQRDMGVLSLGRALFATLPEDRHDRGPATGGDGRFTLVADARIDNRDELLAALGVGPAAGRALSESALLVRLFERWGEAGIERVTGDFAFALWDSAEERLVLGRDYLGHRPLHYHCGEGFFAFASMPRGLHALPAVPYAADPDAAAHFLAELPDRPGRSFFAGIAAVEPGHFLSVTRGGTSARRFWNPDLTPLRLPRAEDYAEALRVLFDDAVSARLRRAGDGRVAAQLSAGLDSAAVAATAARLLAPAPLIAFTAVPREGYDGGSYPGSFADEGPLAAATAALYPNVEHVLVRAGGRSPFTPLDRNFFLFERPVPNLCNATWSDAINEAARARGCKILLTGQLGNVGFSWMGLSALPELAASARLVRLARSVRALRRSGTRWGTIAAQTVGPFLPKPLWRLVALGRGRTSRLKEDSLLSAAAGARLADLGLERETRPPRAGAPARLAALHRLDRGNYGKGILAGWGLDLRDPTADRRLVEFCLRVPEEIFLTGGSVRGLARIAMGDRLPREVLDTRLKGYQTADWHEGVDAGRAELLEELERIADTPGAAAALDPERTARLLAEWPAGEWNSRSVVRRYRRGLLRAVSAGHFLRKAGGGNA